MVVPGDQLIIKVNKKEASSYKVNAFVKDELACSAKLDFWSKKDPTFTL